MIILGDLQIQKRDAHLYGMRSFFKWLIENFKNETIIQVGDWWECTCTHNDIEDEFDGYACQLKELHILSGNHDKNGRNGNALSRLRHHKNIIVYKEPTEMRIDGFKCLMLPFDKKAKEKYTDISFTGDYAFIHDEPIEVSYNNTGLSLPKVNATQIYGHIHLKNILSDRKIILGVVIPNKSNEINNPIMQINKNGISYIDHPIWFEYQNINYGEFPENKNNILNIKNIPSYQSMYELYKGYHIRKKGCTLLRTDNEGTTDNLNFEVGDVVEKFNKYSTDKKLPKEINDCAIRYLQEVI
jgi:hypothetical protein